MKQDVLLKIISKLLRVGSPDKIEKILRTSTQAEIELIFQELGSVSKIRLLSSLFHKRVVSNTIRDFSSELLETIVTEAPQEFMAGVLQELQPDDAADLLGKISEVQKQRLLDVADPEKKKQLQRLLTYSKDTAGGIMNPNVFALIHTSTVTEAIHQLRKQTKIEMVFYLYVVDEERKLVGIISLRQLIMSSGTSVLKEMMDTNVVAVNASMSQKEVAQKISRYNFLAVPVVDDESRLLGVITVDDVIEVVQEESMQDLYRMAGIEKDERVFTPVRSSITKRAPWLMVNLATAVLAANVVAFYEGTIQKVALLAVFLPVVASMGGNAGTQTLVVTIRGLSMGELVLRDVWRAVRKEVLLGVANGILTGLMMAVIAYVWKGIPMLGVILMLAMIGNLFVSGLVGVLVPVGLKALKIDPAVASTVVVTTFTDCFGFFFFLGLSALLIQYLV